MVNTNITTDHGLAPDANAINPNYLYVEVRINEELCTSFNHVFIRAADDDDAENLGIRAMEALNATNTSGHAQMSFSNCYVVRLDGTRKEPDFP